MKYLIAVFTALALMVGVQAAKANSTTDKIAIGIIAGALGYAAGQNHGHGHDHGGGGYYGGYATGNLNNSRLNCRQYNGYAVCSSYIGWFINSNNYNDVGAITVAVPTSDNYFERQERLFACGRNGSQEAPWIYSRHTYIFRLYQARDCRESGYYGRPLDEITIRAY